MDEETLPNVAGNDGDRKNASEVTSTPTTEEQQQASGHSSTADEASSIEALSWSDFEDDEPSSGVDTALLQSIHSQLSEDGTENGVNMSTSAVSNEGKSTIMGDSQETLLLGDSMGDKGSKIGTQGTKRKREESPMMSSTLSARSAASETTGDLSSNAAVLDDGPIWAKGSKRYKFEENRRVNQKLTFGVLLSVVLAMGLGLGNLVAYNECEAEHKASEVPISIPKSPAPITNTPQLPQAPIPAENVIEAISSTPFSTVPSPNQVIPTADVHIPLKEVPEPVKSSRPMVDPKYAQHAEELSKVLKMLDELSRKIDKFENTTRQLGGIVMMKDELEKKEPPTKKTKFLKLLSELMQTKMNKMENKAGAGGQGKTWRDKKEEVLDEIAGMVLEAMEDEDLDLENIVEDDEILLQDSQSFPLDEGEGEKLPDFPEKSLPSGEVRKTIVAPSDKLIVDSLQAPAEVSDDIISPVKPLEIKQSESKHLKEREEADGSNNKKLRRGFAVDMDDDEFEVKVKGDHKHSREGFHKDNPETFQGQRNKKREAFQEQKKQIREEYREQKKHNREAFQKQKKQKREAFQEQKKQIREEFQQQKKHNREAFPEQKKKQEGFQKQVVNEEYQKQKKRDHDEFQKHERIQQKEGSSDLEQKTEQQAFDSDWSNLRAKNREANRRAGEEAKELKINKWQTERSKGREQFRGNRPTN